MTNSETISKLNSALTRLMSAYEELQSESIELKKTIENRDSKISSLEEENSSLMQRVNELKSNTEDDKTTIHTMLGQIETILNKSSQSIVVEQKEEEKIDSPNIITESNSFLSQDEKNEDSVIKALNGDLLDFAPAEDERIVEKEKNSNKLDLNDERLSSLLGIMQ